MAKEIVAIINTNISNASTALNIVNQQLGSLISFKGEKINGDTIKEIARLGEEINKFLTIVNPKRDEELLEGRKSDHIIAIQGN